MMVAFHGSEPPAVAATYDFSAARTLVDVGAGTGNLLTTILFVTPHACGVLYDVPHVVAQAHAMIASRKLADRCTVSEGSFFESAPGAATPICCRTFSMIGTMNGAWPFWEHPGARCGRMGGCS
jgi:hypothetical protein